jgi:hypothetical protein
VILHYKTYYFDKTCAETWNFSLPKKLDLRKNKLFRNRPSTVVFAPGTQTYVTELKNQTIVKELFRFNPLEVTCFSHPEMGAATISKKAGKCRRHFWLCYRWEPLKCNRDLFLRLNNLDVQVKLHASVNHAPCIMTLFTNVAWLTPQKQALTESLTSAFRSILDWARRPGKLLERRLSCMNQVFFKICMGNTHSGKTPEIAGKTKMKGLGAY